MLLVLVLMFYFFPYEGIQPTEFFFNFGNEALITICALLIVGRGLETTGALQPLAVFMVPLLDGATRPGIVFHAYHRRRHQRISEQHAHRCHVIAGPGRSLPARAAAAVEGADADGVLATLIGGMATAIGTSTNLLVVNIAADMGQRRFEMFDFTLPVIFAVWFWPFVTFG